MQVRDIRNIVVEVFFQIEIFNTAEALATHNNNQFEHERLKLD